MNLHIAPDNTFINKFYENLLEAGLADQNKIVVRSNESNLKSIKFDLPFARLYTRAFDDLTGSTANYDKVFIHYFTPLLYRWVATHDFKELSWMIWGGDLYNLSHLDDSCYETITLNRFIRKNRSLKNRLYDLKVRITQRRYYDRAYSKVNNVLTWMKEEYKFATANLPFNAAHKFFFYENQLPYHQLDLFGDVGRESKKLTLIIGNSGSPTNNHLDAVGYMEANRIEADLRIPVSYGDANYISFLKKNLKYKYGNVEFLDSFMPFEEYVAWLTTADGLVMNSLRPLGYGNILMMMYLGKPVFFNAKNISLPDLAVAGIRPLTMQDLKSPYSERWKYSNRAAVKSFLSHERLLKEYALLFK